ncbi:MAG: DUF2062 domain-containing protein, partial [Marinomonas sp.]
FIWAATYNTGQIILHKAHSHAPPPEIIRATKNVMGALFDFNGRAALRALEQIWDPLLFPMLVGGIPLGMMCSIPLYFLTRRAAALFRESRRSKLISKAAEVRARAQQMTDNMAGGAKQT